MKQQIKINYSTLLFLILFITFFSINALPINLAYILALFLFFISFIFIINKKFFKINFFICISIFIFAISFFIIIFQNGYSFVDFDGSLNYKFIIINNALDIYANMPIYKKVFGIGLGNFEFYADIFAHNIFITFLLEFGIVNSVLLIIYFFILYKKSNGYVVYILTPTIIIGFSLFSAYSVSLFIFSNLITCKILAQKHRSFYEKLRS
ncbi:hypothetical protein OFO12_01030 [Campylobacter sp. JMF_04 NA10]|uniref:hypothetical protein n=1 Tax=Campylobacter sp. JMF_04 NA10 TaxID=2983824 RepID=UPI0022E9A294|nr:hypothetical protein [Campylobacter sp. JMF_04 NA10]MDA3075952.1 hypothetical protein [Campylobacter sp. JMF_04 NA10]